VLESAVRALAASQEGFDGRPLVQCFEATQDEGVKWAVINTMVCAKPHSINDWLAKLCESPYWREIVHDLRQDEDPV
jgi:hypothetical protein